MSVERSWATCGLASRTGVHLWTELWRFLAAEVSLIEAVGKLCFKPSAHRNLSLWQTKLVFSDLSFLMQIADKKKLQVAWTSGEVKGSLILGGAAGRALEELTLFIFTVKMFWAYFTFFERSIFCLCFCKAVLCKLLCERISFLWGKREKIMSLCHSVMYCCLLKWEGPCNIFLS